MVYPGDDAVLAACEKRFDIAKEHDTSTLRGIESTVRNKILARYSGVVDGTALSAEQFAADVLSKL